MLQNTDAKCWAAVHDGIYHSLRILPKLMQIAGWLCIMVQIQFPEIFIIHLIVMHWIWKLQSQSLELAVPLTGYMVFIAVFMYESAILEFSYTICQEVELLIQPAVTGVCFFLIAMLALYSTMMITQGQRICYTKAVFWKNNRFSKLKTIVHSQYFRRSLPETTIFFQFCFQTFWNFPKSLEKFGTKFWKTFSKVLSLGTTLLMPL
jgi:hypothetical protein